MDRRTFLTRSAALALPAAAAVPARADEPAGLIRRPPRPANRIGVSTYSFWQFKNNALRSMEACIDLAADMGFDGVEFLHRQMTDESPGALQRLKRRAFLLGLDLMGFSTHQSFLYPDPAERQKNVELTIRQIELAYALGIPTMRVNTGTWRTSKNFDELMKNKGVEPPQPGHTDEEAFDWVIDGFAKCLRAAEKCGVTLG